MLDGYFKAAEGSTTVLDTELGYIYGLDIGLADLEGYVEYSSSVSYETPDGIGTGMTLTTFRGGEEWETYTIIIFGDLDGNSYVNSGDVSICLNEVHGMTGWSVEGGDEYAHYLVKAANVRKDLFITVADYNMINLHALGMEVIDQVTGTLES